jgi:hypothetical protein
MPGKWKNWRQKSAAVVSVTTETVAVVKENSNLFLQMAMESQGSCTEYVLCEYNLLYVISVVISEGVL